MSRRVAISSTPAGGGSAATTSYIWCGTRICQARDATNATIRGYFAEGEFVPGSPGQPYHYAIDQIGSVRRAFADAGNAPAYSYDPYGNALQATASVTDFGYAGMFYNADSGLYLTQFRAYDPVAGRWLSRDPLGETGDDASNLYAYAEGDPLSNIDPDGLKIWLPRSRTLGLTWEQLFPPYCSSGGENPSFPPLVNQENDPLDALGPNSFAGHKKGARPSTTRRHEEGDARRKRDYGGEKGDKRRRPPARRPENFKGSWPPKP